MKLNVDAVFLFHFAHDEGALDGANVVDVAEFGEHELLVLLHVAGAHLKQVVVGTAGVVALGHLWDALDAAHKAVGNLVVDLFQLHFAEHQQPQAQLLGVEDGHIFLDIAFALKPFLAFKHWGGGEVNGVGQLLGGELCVVLQRFKYLQVGFVEVHFVAFLGVIK